MLYEETPTEIVIHVTLEKEDSLECPMCKSKRVHINDYYKKTINHKHFTGKGCTIIWNRRRYKCKECNKTFYENNPFTFGKKESYSIETVLYVLEELAEIQSFKSVALKTGISINKVTDIFDRYVDIKREKMPECLGIDEFHNRSTGTGKYACILINNSDSNPTIVDIIEERSLEILGYFFQYIERDERNNVKYFVSDMYEGYRTVHDVYFPKSIHIIDTFHFIRLFTEALNRIRIKIMKTYKVDSEEYYILKHYYYVLIKTKKSFKKERVFYKHFNREINHYDLLKIVLNVNETLKNAYKIKDYFCSNYYKFDENNATEFIDNEIASLKNSTFEEYNQVASSLSNWKVEILNSFKKIKGKRITNARTEGFNNLIKTIKRSGFGYKNFKRFRNRILHIQKHIKKIK